MTSLATPIIYILFNRPDIVRRTFPAIRDQRPRQLYLIADGPRTHKPGEAALCQQAREAVESLIDWPCQVTRDYSETNLGCGRRLSSGLTTAFDHLGEAIVLEDDILPHPDFFAYCAQELAAHRNTTRIHSVCGFTPFNHYQPSRGPSVASLHTSVWGWASWQRSWRDYTYDISEWLDPKTQATIRNYLKDRRLFRYYNFGFTLHATGGVDTWDYQWAYTMLKHRRFALNTTNNLVTNLGFGEHATHTHTTPLWIAGLQTHAMSSAPQIHSLNGPDRGHDHLHHRIMKSKSRLRIATARLIAQSRLLSHWLRL